MISICIPIYNYDVRPLVNELLIQVEKNDFLAEIILIDDCSNDEFREINKALSINNNYIQLDVNIGRSKIRNLFLKYAKYDFLLFLDCDSLIISDKFLENYYAAIYNTDTKIVCGGRVYPSEKPSANKLLSWKYGTLVESKTVENNKAQAYKSFMTNNFIVDKSVLSSVRFDERISKYGHEDTLFGYQLKKNDIGIEYIKNPILNGDIEPNDEYLRKTEIGLINLICILKYVNYDVNFIDDVKILKFYYSIKNKHLLPIINIAFFISNKTIKKLLINGRGGINLFNFYKLGYISCYFKSVDEC